VLAHPLYKGFEGLITTRRMVFFAGLPGVGKSLHLKNFAGLAQDAGRKVHLLQWDVTRAAFETDEILARYPEVDGVTHAGVRKAVGLWARRGVLRWHRAHPDPSHLLVGEVPLVGNRLIELVQPLDDEVEPLLSSDAALFITPVPSAEVRRHIEAAREQSIAQPSHERERADAPPNVLKALWLELHTVAQKLGLATNSAYPDRNPPDYNPEVYAAVFDHLLRHRHRETLWVNDLLPATGSVYDFEGIESELVATPEEVMSSLETVDNRYTQEGLEQAVAAWYDV